MINAIVSVDENWGVGKEGKLLFSLPPDMKFFREKTLGKTVVAGRKTLMSFPGGNPLKNRETIVISSSMKNRDDCIVVGDITSLKKIMQKKDEVWVIGGGKVYEELLPFCEKAYVTKVFASAGADAFFPNLDADSRWEQVEAGDRQSFDGLDFCFTVYRNLRPEPLG